uniref:Putative Glycosyl transferase, group 1 n=1 Tax=mine drainage metagenome TaxID=410659 RepID=E6Q781_9ZZZZ
MRVAFDAQPTIGSATGIGEYARELERALRELPGMDVVPLSAPGLDPWRFDRRAYWDQVLLPIAAARSHATILHCTSGTMPAFSKLPIVLTLHDAAWLRVQGHTRFYARAYFGALMKRLAERAREIVTVSAFSAREILELHPGLDERRVHVIPLGVADDFARLQIGGGDEATILAVGTVEARKNLEVVIRALPSLPGVRAISVGPSTPYRDACAAIARELGVEDRLEFRGYVGRSALLDLYATSTVLAMPSRYEGFGLPLAQACCAGLPAIAARGSSLDEIAGESVPRIDADDVSAWSEALARVFADPERARSAAAAERAAAIERFSWRRAASATAEIYRIAST